ncbi:putative reverse transcriptase domain-containing protein [Tanacetum coccineum]
MVIVTFGESGIRVNIVDFAGDTLSLEGFIDWLVAVEEVVGNPGDTLSLEGFIDWLVAVEEVFEFKEVPKNKRVSLIATKIHSRASALWQQLKLIRERNLKQGSKFVEDYTTEFYQLIARNDIQETEYQLVSQYIGGLRVQIMYSVNMFDPMTLSDAYQCASGSGNVASCFAPSQAKVGGGNTGPDSRASGSSGLKCFNCGEPGHQQSECKKAEAVQKLGLKTENHPKPYKLKWLKKGGKVTVSKRVHVLFSMGNTYKDNVWCDVVPMDACHFEDFLMPNKPKEVVSKPIGTLLTLLQFEDELEMGNEGFGLQKFYNQPKGGYSYVRLVFLFDLSGHGPKTDL